MDKQNEQIQKLQKLVQALIEELQIRVEDRADSSLPEWEREAKRLGCKIQSR